MALLRVSSLNLFDSGGPSCLGKIELPAPFKAITRIRSSMTSTPSLIPLIAAFKIRSDWDDRSSEGCSTLVVRDSIALDFNLSRRPEVRASSSAIHARGAASEE